MDMAIRAIIFLIFNFILGCTTTGSLTIDNLQVSIGDLQKLVTSQLPLGLRQQSQNGREFSSEYFVVKQGDYVQAVSSARRNYAKISILGDRRPYNLEIIVFAEERDGSGQYRVVKYDEGMARVISRRIEQALHKRREDRNIIDDFRVF